MGLGLGYAQEGELCSQIPQKVSFMPYLPTRGGLTLCHYAHALSLAM